MLGGVPKYEHSSQRPKTTKLVSQLLRRVIFLDPSVLATTSTLANPSHNSRVPRVHSPSRATTQEMLFRATTQGIPCALTPIPSHNSRIKNTNTVVVKIACQGTHTTRRYALLDRLEAATLRSCHLPWPPSTFDCRCSSSDAAPVAPSRKPKPTPLLQSESAPALSPPHVLQPPPRRDDNCRDNDHRLLALMSLARASGSTSVPAYQIQVCHQKGDIPIAAASFGTRTHRHSTMLNTFLAASPSPATSAIRATIAAVLEREPISTFPQQQWNQPLRRFCRHRGNPGGSSTETLNGLERKR
ncbi:hypothetical protein DEO72_LG4g239 [Vigna unguiculata]|uniref:Uncharacterized protein n=1 Tax=Vigna unguiculata TaxID=3917 RepID=A0A4D6LLV4_VIGUN|nr:hypothetical protein DEO72_LG4g239 [Vigna unguiculata]